MSVRIIKMVPNEATNVESINGFRLKRESAQLERTKNKWFVTKKTKGTFSPFFAQLLIQGLLILSSDFAKYQAEKRPFFKL